MLALDFLSSSLIPNFTPKYGGGIEWPAELGGAKESP